MWSNKKKDNRLPYDDVLLSKTIDWLRFPMVLLVIFVHSQGRNYVSSSPSIGLELSILDLYDYFRNFLSVQMGRVAVPVFFFISGFLFFYKTREWNVSVYLRKMKKRILTLIVPYIVWNFSDVLIVTVKKLFAFIIKGKPFSNVLDYWSSLDLYRILWDNVTWPRYEAVNWLGVETYMSGPANIPLWFLRDLIVVCVLAPIVYLVVKRTGRWGLLVLGLAYASKVWLQWPGFSIEAMFFFSWGAYFSVHEKNFVEWFRTVSIPCYILAPLLAMVFTLCHGKTLLPVQYLNGLFIATSLVAAINLSSSLLRSGKTKVVPLLAQSSFFIYALHEVDILPEIKRFCSKIFPQDQLWALTLDYLFVPVITAAICVLIYWFIKKFVPALLVPLTGGR